MQKSIVNVLPRLLLAVLLTAGAGTAARAEVVSQDPPNAGHYTGEVTGIEGITLTVRGRQFKATMDVTVVSANGDTSNNLLPVKEGDTVDITYYDNGGEAPDASRIEILPEALPPT